MTAWLLKAIGISNSSITSNIDKVQLLLHRPLYFWLGLIVAAGAGYLIVRRHRRNLPHIGKGPRAILNTCRIGVLLLLVIVLAGPYLRLDEPQEQKPVVAVLIDESASMSLPAGPYKDEEIPALAQAAGLLVKPEEKKPESPATTDPAAPAAAPAPTPAAPPAVVPLDPELRKKMNSISRQDLLQAVLNTQKKELFEKMQERFDVRFYRVAKESRTASLDTVPEALTPAAAAETALGNALEKAIDAAAGQHLAALVIMSDGRNTAGSDPLQVLRRTGSAAGSDAAAPVWAIPVGSQQPPADIALLDLLAPGQLAQGDNANIVATVSSQGFEGKPVVVSLFDGDTELDKKPLTLHDGQRQQVQLAFKADSPGAKLLKVKVQEMPEEQLHENNVQPLVLEVESDKRKVLFLENSARWDFRFLDHALRRDHGLEVQFVMESQLLANGTALADLPTVAQIPEDAAGYREYSVVILGDITTDLLPVRYQEQLRKAVEEDGLGLIIQAGAQHMPEDFLGMPLAKILPLRFDPPAQSQPSTDGLLFKHTGLDAPAFAPFKMKVTASGSTHQAFQLYDSASKNRDIWSHMPPFFWAAAAKEATPAATVLASFEAPGVSRPLIAQQYVGRGRVLFIGMDSTFRWRRNIGSHLFYRFWGQAIRHVAKNNQRRPDRSWMEINPRRVEPGEPVAIHLYTIEEDGTPSQRPRQTVNVSMGDWADVITLEADRESGYFTGEYRPEKLGDHRIAYTDEKGATISSAVRVAGSGQEMLRIAVDRDGLGALADASSGGVLELPLITELPKKLKGEPTKVRRVHEEEAWDNWLTLVLLVGLYCVDVGMRRMLGLT